MENLVLSEKVDYTGSPRLAAFHNVADSVNPTALLPQQVFLGAWDQFFFFESDHMFAPSFAEIAIDLIHIERATSCCLLNFSRTRVLEYQEAAAIFLEEGLRASDYDSWLRNGGPAAGWLFSMERYGCSSDKGEWCIYSEKQNDIAIIGLRCRDDARRFASTLEKLHAASIETLVQKGPPAPVPFSMLTAEWRRALVEHYASESVR
jgi:hypothetical protein